MKTNWSTACGVFESFSHFQLIGKTPKINRYFFDEKNQKTFWSSEKNLVEKISMFMTSVEKSTVFKRISTHPESGLVNDLGARYHSGNFPFDVPAAEKMRFRGKVTDNLNSAFIPRPRMI